MIDLILILGIIGAAFLAVGFSNLLAAAVGLSAVSALLAILFYQAGATVAALFELSVGAGLVTVMFICAISLVKSGRETDSERKRIFGRIVTLLNVSVVALIFYNTARIIMTHPPKIVKPIPSPETVGGILWGARSWDAVGQAVIVFGCILGIILLFRKEEES